MSYVATGGNPGNKNINSADLSAAIAAYDWSKIKNCQTGSDGRRFMYCSAKDCPPGWTKVMAYGGKGQGAGYKATEPYVGFPGSGPELQVGPKPSESVDSGTFWKPSERKLNVTKPTSNLPLVLGVGAVLVLGLFLLSK
jgi:hypothetical protein